MVKLRPLLYSCTLLGFLLCTLPVGANPEYWKNPKFEQGLRARTKDQWVETRKIAESMLAADRKDYCGLYLMAQVYFHAEGSLPRALHYIEQARHEIESSWGKTVPSHGPWRIHSQVVITQILLLQQMERYQQALDEVHLYNRNYRPPLLSMEGWPLLKLGRVEEARNKMKFALERCDPNDWDEKSAVLNSMGNIEFETGHLPEAYDCFMQMVEHYESTPAQPNFEPDPVYWGNAGESARDMLQFDQAEKLYLGATQHFSGTTYSDPWKVLGELYLAQARYPEAVQALKQMQLWRLSNTPQVAQNKWADCHLTAGIGLFSLGYDHESLQVMERLVNRPDRNSGISTKASLIEGRAQYVYALVLGNVIERVREERSWSNWRDWPALTWQIVGLEQKQALARSQAANLLSCGTGLVGLVQPYGNLSLDHPWMAPAAWTFFGSGPVNAAVDQRLKLVDKAQQANPSALALKYHFEPKREVPFLQATQVESLRAQGSLGQAEKLAKQCLDGLPPKELALRRRVLANLAAIKEIDGKTDESLRLFQQLMESDPTLLRQLHLALPIQFSASGDLAQQAAARLAYSPRFVIRAQAFKAQLQSQGSDITAVLLGPDGTVLKTIRSSVSSKNAGERPSADQVAMDFCREFHQEIFSPVVDLSQSDIYSIDGSTGATSSRQLEKLFK